MDWASQVDGGSGQVPCYFGQLLSALHDRVGITFNMKLSTGSRAALSTSRMAGGNVLDLGGYGQNGTRGGGKWLGWVAD